VKNVAAVLIILFCLPLSAAAEEVTFLYMKQSGYDLPDIVERAQSFLRKTGIRVNPVFVEYKDRYSLIAESSRKATPDYDLILLDLIWTADFAEHGIIDPLPTDLANATTSGVVPKIYDAFSYRGRLWALPFHVDFQLFYTNLDLLSKAGYTSPPHTLEEMVQMARDARKKGVIEYPLFDSWNEQEVLVCEFTWLAGAFGGSLTDQGGRINCVSPPCIDALRFMIGLLQEGLINPFSLQSEENFTSEVFQAGDCLFTTNWSFLIRLLGSSQQQAPFRWALSPIPASKAALRSGVSTSSVCGFEGLAVTSRSRHKEAAWRFARYLDSPEFQGRHLEFMPVWKEVWDWPATQRDDPFMSIKQLEIAGLQYRPVHPRYAEISRVLQEWLFKALKGVVPPEQALREAQKGINAITGQGR
jgi:multiple sugar transport system substrate-binding protein